MYYSLKGNEVKRFGGFFITDRGSYEKESLALIDVLKESTTNITFIQAAQFIQLYKDREITINALSVVCDEVFTTEVAHCVTSIAIAIKREERI